MVAAAHAPEHVHLPSARQQAQVMVHDFSPQEISNLLWAYAKLNVQPSHKLLGALWESIGVSSVSSSDSSSGGGGAGSVGARLSAFKPQELSMLVWALAVLQLVPGGDMVKGLHALAVEVLPRHANSG